MNLQVSVIIPTVNEKGIEDVLSKIDRTCDKQDIHEIIIVKSALTTAEYCSFLEKMEQRFSDFHFRFLSQPGSGVGDAAYWGVSHVTGSHFIAIGADMENDPADMAKMIALAKDHPHTIITASRRLAPEAFRYYSATKRLFNDLFQLFLRILFSSRQTDITYAFQCVPSEVLPNCRFEEDHNAFVLELALLPEILRIPFIEIPSVVGKRTEGKSHSDLRYYRNFLWKALRLFYRKKHNTSAGE